MTTRTPKVAFSTPSCRSQIGAGVTFYIHVVDWGSNARPDKLYDLVISGVN